MLNMAIDQREFLAEYFEKHVLLSRHAVSMCLIDWHEISEVLSTLDPTETRLRLFNEGFVDQFNYVERFQDIQQIRSRLNNRALEAYLGQGATLIIDRIERRVPVIAALCQELADFVNEKTVANAYLAFGGAGSFGKHWDTHDVFAVQLLGHKRWTVFKPTFPLPLAEQKCRGYANHLPQQLVFDGVLHPGDVLYVPRGWWHEAIPLERQETFHLAIGTHTAKMVDYVTWLCNQVLPASLDARRTFKRNADNTAELQAFLRIFLQAFNEPKNLAVFDECLTSLGNKNEKLDLEHFIPKANSLIVNGASD